MKINFEDIEKHLEQRKKYNSIDIKDIELYKNGKRIIFDEKKMKEMSYCGFHTLDTICYLMEKG